MNKNNPSGSLSYQVITLLVAVSLVVGVLASAKFAYNLLQPKYPYGGVIPDLSLSSSTQPAYYQREEDCTYPQVYYGPEGTTRPATDEEKLVATDSRDRCLLMVSQARQQAKEQDASLAGFFILAGVGLLVARRFLIGN